MPQNVNFHLNPRQSSTHQPCPPVLSPIIEVEPPLTSDNHQRKQIHHHHLIPPAIGRAERASLDHVLRPLAYRTTNCHAHHFHAPQMDQMDQIVFVPDEEILTIELPTEQENRIQGPSGRSRKLSWIKAFFFVSTVVLAWIALLTAFRMNFKSLINGKNQNKESMNQLGVALGLLTIIGLGVIIWRFSTRCFIRKSINV